MSTILSRGKTSKRSCSISPRPCPQMIQLVGNLKARHGLKVVAIGNEGWELAAHRIEKFA